MADSSIPHIQNFSLSNSPEIPPRRHSTSFKKEDLNFTSSQIPSEAKQLNQSCSSPSKFYLNFASTRPKTKHVSLMSSKPIKPKEFNTFFPESSNFFNDKFTKYYESMRGIGKLKLSDITYDFTTDDLKDIGEIGRGAFGTVNKMVHKQSNTMMAVKRLRSTVDEKEQKQLLMDLEVIMKIKPKECSFLVQFYGALFKEGDCWICMEIMDTSLDKFYKFIYEKLKVRIPESILGKISLATLHALNYLKEELKIIHRDVKPSNILLDRQGHIKLCDFGISGQLVDSIARTRDAGCRPYMAPERIDPNRAFGYDVRSDVWSLGITLMEVATGKFPYPKWSSIFEQLYRVLQGDPPQLSTNYNSFDFSEEFVDFVNTCLIKDEQVRPKYIKLLQHPFVKYSQEDETINVANYVCEILDKMIEFGVNEFTTNQQY